MTLANHLASHRNACRILSFDRRVEAQLAIHFPHSVMRTRMASSAHRLHQNCQDFHIHH
eukprot:SAG22_NODE_11034_length_504_cov_0.639506_1_plen_58_part_10